MILLIDNYDSFTFNLFQYIRELGFECDVRRNDRVTIDEIKRLNPTRIVLSPGPGRPESAGIMPELIKSFAGIIPILGICLGHQAIGEAFGGQIVRAPIPMHGKTSSIFHTYESLPSPLSATRYHSLVVNRSTLPECFEVTAETNDGLIMGLRHRTFDLEGVQFHPESILTKLGKDLLKQLLGGSA